MVLRKETYYRKNKDKWKKGGMYYKYVSVRDKQYTIPIIIKRGVFILSFE